MSETTAASILYLDGERADSPILPILRRDLPVRWGPASDDTAAACEAAEDEHLNLVARAGAIKAAARLIAAQPGRVESLSVMAPPAAAADGKLSAELAGLLGAIKLPTMLLFGTRDAASPPPLGRVYQRVLPQARIMFVYDATGEMDKERPDAVAAILREFILAKDRFVVTHKSGRLYP